MSVFLRKSFDDAVILGGQVWSRGCGGGGLTPGTFLFLLEPFQSAIQLHGHQSVNQPFGHTVIQSVGQTVS